MKDKELRLIDILHLCSFALEELKKHQDSVIYVDEIICWVKKHQRVRKELTINRRILEPHKDFCQHYLFLDTISRLLKLEKDAKDALNAFENINSENELEILEWLKCTYKTYCVILVFGRLIFEIPEVSGLIRISEKYNIHFEIKHLNNCRTLVDKYSECNYLKEKHEKDYPTDVEDEFFVKCFGDLIEM